MKKSKVASPPNFLKKNVANKKIKVNDSLKKNMVAEISI